MEARGGPINDLRSVLIWLGRALANALAGGLAFAFVGAFCGGAAALLVALLICLLENAGIGEGSLIAVPIGASVGAMCGIAGIFVHLFPALHADPGKFWQPFLNLAARASWGQMWGTIVACTAFVACELMRSQFNNARLSNNISEDFIIFAFVAPAMMILGAIAAAIFKRN